MPRITPAPAAVALTVAVAALASACTHEPEIDYRLTLVPETLPSQNAVLLAAEPDVKVKLDYPDGSSELLYVGQAKAGASLEIGELASIPADTVVGLIGETPGGPTDAVNPTRVIAYGEAVVDAALADGAQQVELTIPWLRVDTIGKLLALEDADRIVGGAVAVVPNGSIYVFGGGDPGTRESVEIPGQGEITLMSSDKVLALERTDTGGWSDAFVEVGTMPSSTHLLGTGYSDEVETARAVQMTATVVGEGDDAKILVVGGRYTYYFTAFQSPTWFLWDPKTNSIAEQGALFNARSGHLAIPLGDAKVLLYGGFVDLGIGVTPLYEIWTEATLTSVYGRHNNLFGTTALNGCGAQLTGGDAVICGGSRFVSVSLTESDWDPVADCFRFTPADAVTAIAPLPVPLAGAAMARLADGGVLVTGGMEESLVDVAGGSDVAPAVNHAYRWHPVTGDWTEVGAMGFARAHHQMVPLSDGRVVVIGGTANGSSIFGSVNEPVRCTEVFDPDSETFSVSACVDPGRGAFPAVGGSPETGYAVMEGLMYEGLGMSGGSAFGVIGGQPEL